MQYTTFNNEELIFTTPNGETLVRVNGNLEPHRRFFVAVTRDGFRTDYPLLCAPYDVRWDNPEWFTKKFRIRASKAICKLAYV